MPRTEASKTRDMRRALGLIIVTFVAFGGLAGCSRTSDRWEQQIAAWPEDRPTGGTPTEFREYHEARDNFAEMMAEENEMAEH